MVRSTAYMCLGLISISALIGLADEPATQPGNDAPTSWKKLYADEKWYNDLNRKERIFTGTLQLHAEPEMGISMRPHRYELGDRLIYPDTKNPNLEALIGKKVEIRGKANDEKLEGSNLKEIWPAAIRGAEAPAATTGPATMPAGAAVPFEIYNGYFVSNEFEPKKAASFVALADGPAFDRVFGVARVMNDASHRLPGDAFASKIVIAAIKRGDSLWQFQVQSVTLQGRVLTIHYSATAQRQPSAEFACPLIIAVPKGNFADVVFMENGKSVNTLGIASPP